MHLPYITLPSLDLSVVGLGQLDWFALFVFAAIVAGVATYDYAISRGGDVERGAARVLPEMVVVGGFVGAHLVHVLAYHPELMRDDPWVLLKVWAGMSSVGGFAGAAVAAVLTLRWRRQPFVPYADRLVFGLTAGWVFGRLGCTTAHDHPGLPTSFILGVAYPDGVRHDLGLDELLFTVLLVAPVLLFLSRRPWRSGTLVGAWLLLYGSGRFFLDFLRATDRSFVDARYFGLTPAQYACVLMAAAGALLLARARRSTAAKQPALWGARMQRDLQSARDVV